MDNSSLLKSNIADELRVEGINFKGYGIIPKFVMLDADLSIEAKGIYSYFCSFAGAGNTAFPGRDKIVSDLGINKDSYYKHYNQLIKNGYISVTQTNDGRRGAGFRKNIYTLVSSPEKISESEYVSSINNSPLIISSGIKSFGYGFIAKAVMIDSRISLRAKALYSYYCAFTGSDSSACPSRDVITHHLNISKNSLAKYNKELLDVNFIEVVQRRTNGKLGINDYFIVDKPGSITVLPCTNLSDTQKPDTLNSDTQKPDSQISDTNINNPKTNNNIINNPSFVHSSRRVGEESSSIVIDIQKAKCIPSSVLDNSDCLEKSVFFLCDYERCSDRSIYEDTSVMPASFRYNSYMLFVDALIALLSDHHKKDYNGLQLTRLNILKRINRCLTEMPDGRVSLLPLIEASQYRYMKASELTVPKWPIKFMQHMILNALVEGDIETDSRIIHDFHVNSP